LRQCAANSARSLLNSPDPMRTIVRITCRSPNAGADAPTLEVFSKPRRQQQRALDFIQQIRL
jgi:hypothetical protein